MQRMFRAMQRYGLIVADNGSDMMISGTMDPRWNNDVLNPAFHGLTADDFEVIQLGWRGTDRHRPHRPIYESPAEHRKPRATRRADGANRRGHLIIESWKTSARLVLGMGGSSLGPEVLATTFPKKAGFPKLHVLD